MNGVPADLPIQPFVGKDLNQICLGRFQISAPLDVRQRLYNPAAAVTEPMEGTP